MPDFRFHGIYPMLYAFFGADGALDRDAMRRQVEGCIAGGVHGLAIGGLATECNKLSSDEKLTLFTWVLEDTAGRVPVSVTVSAPTTEEQISMVKTAAGQGAGWAVLQPPPVPEISETERVAFFGKVHGIPDFVSCLTFSED